MNKYELKLWKEELVIRKEQNSIKLKEISMKLDALQYRLKMIHDLKEQLHSNLMFEMEQQLCLLLTNQEQLEKENTDIETILFSIEVETGNLFICR